MLKPYRFTLLALLWAGLAQAQISDGGLPPSLQSAHAPLFASKKPPARVLPPPALEKIREEDAAMPWRGRFAVPMTTDVSPEQQGVWTTLPNGDRIWQADVVAPDALGLVLLFDEFRLPPGAQFFAYTPDQSRVKGAYTTKSCLPSGKFTIGVLPGEQARLELYEPANVQGQSRIHLNRVDYAYDRAALAEGDPAASADFGESLPCNINVNCTQGANWQVEKKGVARILMVFNGNGLGQNAGSAWCTGSLVANTGGTGTPYFLTAHHCQILLSGPDFDQWVFDFDYESPTCSNPVIEPAAKSVLGCENIASRAETDFMLLKLNPIPTAYSLYFNGWDRTATPNVSQTVFVHHPFGDIKKITVDNQPATVFPQTLNWGAQFGISPANSHWKTIHDAGIFQPGSSGCPLFNPNKHIVGQLHGGSWNQMNPCLDNVAYFGRFDLSWSQGAAPNSRLKEWLDPGNTGANTQNGYQQPIPPTNSISGSVQTFWGAPMAGVQVAISGSVTDTITTDNSGLYNFPELPTGGTYVITPFRDGNDINGLSTFDLVLFSKHILGIDPLNSPWKIIAIDVNKSNSATTFDIVETRKLLLGLYGEFPNNSAWRFFKSDWTFNDPALPFQNMPPENQTFFNLQSNIQNASFYGVKVGDANNTADPGQ